MATTTTAHNLGHQHRLPPSPPSSPTSRVPNRPRKRRDSIAALLNSPPLSPTLAEPEEPLRTRLWNILLTPFLLTSFILSLTLVSLHDRYTRALEHSTSRTNSFSTFFSPEPYADDPGDTASGEEAKGKSTKRNSWHLTKKIRKITRLEVSDAFEMRGRVMLGMGVVGMLGLVTMVGGVRWVWGWVMGRK